jgi:hypothetical protein
LSALEHPIRRRKGMAKRSKGHIVTLASVLVDDGVLRFVL